MELNNIRLSEVPNSERQTPCFHSKADPGFQILDVYVYLGVTSGAREIERDHCWGLGWGTVEHMWQAGTGRNTDTGNDAVGTGMGVAEEERLRELVKTKDVWKTHTETYFVN